MPFVDIWWDWLVTTQLLWFALLPLFLIFFVLSLIWDWVRDKFTK